MIQVGRTTFFGAEAISSCVVNSSHLSNPFDTKSPLFVQEFTNQVYRINGYMLNHIFFDSNCKLAQHVRNTGDPAFIGVGLTVDVFHFTCKHSDKDKFGWYLISSIAEQTNVWLGGFHAILWEMLPERYHSIWAR
jgi:hypothetical protein